MIRKYWIQKKKFGSSQHAHIDWELMHKAHQELAPSRRQWISKLLTGVCGVGKVLKRIKYQPHSRCPRCNVGGETVRHVLQCPAPTAKSTWNLDLSKLRKWMEQNGGCPDMIDIVISSMQCCQSFGTHSADYVEDPLLRKALQR